MNNVLKPLFILLIFILATRPIFAADVAIERNGSSHALAKLRQLHNGEAVKFRIVQLGDSHTAGGLLTDTVREILQEKWGNGGIGSNYPNKIKYQNSPLDYDNNTWLVQTSRQASGDFPMGGVFTRSQGNAPLRVDAFTGSLNAQNMAVMVKPIAAQSDLHIIDNHGKITRLFALHGDVWQHFSFQAALPVQFVPQGNDVWEIGLIHTENQTDRGLIFSALGLNGAQLTQSQKWRTDWGQDLADTRADLVILAYGTNEAFNQTLNLAETRQYWRDVIAEIRFRLPESAILLLGAPESLADGAGWCGTRAPRLDDVQKMQQDLAQSEGVWFWSWQNAMGGVCSMKSWQNKGLAQKDGVHFTADGYRELGKLLSKAIINIAE